jgi:hypothetical protein
MRLHRMAGIWPKRTMRLADSALLAVPQGRGWGLLADSVAGEQWIRSQGLFDAKFDTRRDLLACVEALGSSAALPLRLTPEIRRSVTGDRVSADGNFRIYRCPSGRGWMMACQAGPKANGHVYFDTLHQAMTSLADWSVLPGRG